MIDYTPPEITNIVNVTIPCGGDYSPSAIGSPTVTDNEDISPTVDYRDASTVNCSLNRLWIASDDAGNSASATQLVKFTSPQPPVVTSSSQTTVACGSIEDANSNLEHNMISVHHPCGRPVTVNFMDSANLTQCGFSFSRAWVVTDDCGRSALFTQIVRVLGQQFPDSPPNGLLNAPVSTPLMWPQYPSATSYRVFVWPQSLEERPSEPTTVTSLRMYFPNPHYPPGTRMLWQIEYVLGEFDTIVPSPVWGFETVPKPDMEVASVDVPSFAYSGQSFDVVWTVLNTGNLSVTNFFYDDVYLSRTTSFSDSRHVRRVFQSRFLDPQDGYSSMAEINLAHADIGVFYVFVMTDATRLVS